MSVVVTLRKPPALRVLLDLPETDPDLDVDTVDQERPRTRAECVDGERPCPWISCRFHTYFETHGMTGSEDEILSMKETCSLDVADRGGATLEEVAQVFGVSRERIRQIEELAFKKLRRYGIILGLT